MEISGIKSKLYQAVVEITKEQVPVDLKKELIKEQMETMQIKKVAEPLKGMKVDLYT